VNDRFLLAKRLAQAKSALVVLQDRLPEHLRTELLQARQRGVEVEVLFRRFREGTYLNDLYQAGMRLFETALPEHEPSQLFVDQREGYAVPSGTAIEGAFSRICELLWRRIAVVMKTRGRVKKVFPQDFLVELEAGKPVFINIRGLGTVPLPKEGEAITVLGVADFLGMRGMALTWTLHISSP